MNSDFRSLSDGESPRSLRRVGVSSNLKVLVLGPHPDDFDAIGVTLRFLRSDGNPIEVGVCRTGSGVEDSYVASATLGDKARLREREQRASLRFFGLPDTCLTFLDLENDDEDQPKDVPANRDRLEQFILTRRPDVVSLPHGNDTNSGHRAIYSMFTQIASQSGLPIVAFLARDPKTISMRTDVYTPFGAKDAKWKAELLRFHDSQHQRNLNTRGHGFDDRILNLNKQIARELPLDEAYAEAFELEFYNMPAE